MTALIRNRNQPRSGDLMDLEKTSIKLLFKTNLWLKEDVDSQLEGSHDLNSEQK